MFFITIFNFFSGFDCYSYITFTWLLLAALVILLVLFVLLLWMIKRKPAKDYPDYPERDQSVFSINQRMDQRPNQFRDMYYDKAHSILHERHLREQSIPEDVQNALRGGQYGRTSSFKGVNTANFSRGTKSRWRESLTNNRM